jgi:S-adenosylmethionine-diacylgycerolhomoserine-N-methlytransferase
MSVRSDLRVLRHMAFAPIRGKTHAERLESFYAGQADDYDGFRRRLLHGREELVGRLPSEPGQVWLDMGGGTGANLEFAADDLPARKAVYLVDLSPSLLQRAARRIAERGWQHVHTVVADACTYRPPEPADVVLFSYSLTMIPDWHAALLNAHAALRPGGWIGVVDFHVARKYPAEGHRRHGWLARWFWRVWFDRDNVWLSPDHLPFLERLFETEFLAERTGAVPYLPFLRAPHYLFVGRKSKDAANWSKDSCGAEDSTRS